MLQGCTLAKWCPKIVFLSSVTSFTYVTWYRAHQVSQEHLENLADLEMLVPQEMQVQKAVEEKLGSVG